MLTFYKLHELSYVRQLCTNSGRLVPPTEQNAAILGGVDPRCSVCFRRIPTEKVEG